jgi:hypothetical protein
MIFPGMDPYLEDPHLWSGVHARLIVYVCDYLQPFLRPRYLAAIEDRVYLQGTETERIPDVWIRRRKRQPKSPVATLEADEAVVVQVPNGEVHESYVTILDTYADEKLVAVIEVVSPTNKYAGPGRDSYRAKQKEVLASKAHLIEIDLLRTGPHVLAVAEWAARSQRPYDYLACVNRANEPREAFALYPRALRQRLPRVSIPLAGADKPVTLDVQAVVEQTYEQGRYRERIAYDKPCMPPLSADDQTWANRLLRIAKARTPPRNGKGKGARKKSS